MYKILVQSWVMAGVDATPAIDVRIIEFDSILSADIAFEKILQTSKALFTNAMQNRVMPIKLYERG